MIFGFLPIRCATPRIAARSHSSGTPVKSCSTTRATTNGISSVRGAFGAQLASSRTCSSVTFLPSQLRSTLSSTMRMETGSREMLADAGRLERGQRIVASRDARLGGKRLQRAVQIVRHGKAFLRSRRSRVAAQCRRCEKPQRMRLFPDHALDVDRLPRFERDVARLLSGLARRRPICRRSTISTSDMFIIGGS